VASKDEDVVPENIREEHLALCK